MDQETFGGASSVQTGTSDFQNHSPNANATQEPIFVEESKYRERRRLWRSAQVKDRCQPGALQPQLLPARHSRLGRNGRMLTDIGDRPLQSIASYRDCRSYRDWRFPKFRCYQITSATAGIWRFCRMECPSKVPSPALLGNTTFLYQMMKFYVDGLLCQFQACLV